MRRITVDEVRAAMEKTGYSLRPSCTLSSDELCGCPVAIVALSDGAIDPSGWNTPIGAMRAIGLDIEYGFGLVNGFDWPNNRHIPDRCDLRRKLGIEDGRAIREALMPAEVSR